MDAGTRRALIEKYRQGYDQVKAALAGASDAELDARPAPGKWTAREIVHHLADSEMTAAVRLRRLLAEERPEIVGYDQDEFSRKLHYDRPHEASLELFRSVRESTGELLDRMQPADWLREGTHNEVGRYTPETWLKIYSVHAHKHALQIRAARDAARKQTV